MKMWRTVSTGTIGQKSCDNDIKCDYQTTTETTTCIGVTGINSEIVLSGCHSGNIHIGKISQLNDYKTIYNAHRSLIRVLISLTSLNHQYFISADVSGTIKVWPTNINPKPEKPSGKANSGLDLSPKN